MNNPENRSRLLLKFLQGTLTRKEQQKLDKWKLESPDNARFLDDLSRLKQGEARVETTSSTGSLEDRIFKKISAQIPELEGRRIVRKNHTWRYVAAAAAVVVLAVNITLFMTNNQKKAPQSVATTVAPQMNDVEAPEGVYASITLSNGEKIDLNNTGNGKFASQGKIEMIKSEDGLIIYKASGGSAKGQLQYNTLTNPKGSNVIGMVLEDGTRVWLNAESSLTYPVAFIGNERKVSISGEAYFEVAKNKAKPFRVTRDGVDVTVLGTHFNVNAYADEPNVQVTLLEGSVKVKSGQSSGILKPGQQARIKDDNINTQSNVNVDRIVAWKNGYFSFEKADVAEVMNQIARWYNVEIKYEGQVPDQRFGGELRRNSKLSSVLKILGTSGVKFKVEGNTVTVLK